MSFPENFLHYIWQHRLYKTIHLFCTGGEKLSILDPGRSNKNAGPDFNQVMLQIGDTVWSGDVEIHIKSSDWLLHRHEVDPAYDAVILHAVYKHDQVIYRRDGSLIPVLIMEDLFAAQLLHNYEQLIHSVNFFPCEKQLYSVEKVIVEGFLSSIIVARFEQKCNLVLEQLEKMQGDWEGTFYYFMAKSFGFKVNEIPFELLAAALPHQLLSKHRDKAIQLQALVFGQAGFLNALSISQEVYPARLKKEYEFLRKKYGLTPIAVSSWRFLRMRPQNFPTLRLAQFCGLLLKSDRLLSKIMDLEDLKAVIKLLQELFVDPYWQTHYHFLKTTKSVRLQLGIQSVQHVIINTVCTFLFAYGKYTDRPELISRALRFLEEMPAEKNAVVRRYQDSGVAINSAFFSQAILQLNKYYCAQKKCLNCGIGIKILNK